MKTLFLALALAVTFAAPSMASEFPTNSPGRFRPAKSSWSPQCDRLLSLELRALSIRRPHFL